MRVKSVLRVAVLAGLALVLVVSAGCKKQQPVAPTTTTEQTPAIKTPTRSPSPTAALTSTASGAEIVQFATVATASSQYAADSWSAAQATGEPNVRECGDITGAWAAGSRDTIESIDLTYQTPVVATGVDVYETYTSGHVIKIEVRFEMGDWQEVWPRAGERDMTPCPGVLRARFPKTANTVNEVRVTIDQRNAESWSEIDAVALIGERQASPTATATAARPASTG